MAPSATWRAAGFDHYLVKPVDLRTLYQVIAGPASWGRLTGSMRSRDES